MKQLTGASLQQLLAYVQNSLGLPGIKLQLATDPSHSMAK